MDIKITKSENEEIICNDKEQIVLITMIDEDGKIDVATRTLGLVVILELFISQQVEIEELKTEVELIKKSLPK